MRNSPLGLSTSQAADALGVSLGTIRRWADMGYLESYRTPGGQRRFSVEQIEQFLETLQQRRAGQPHEPGTSGQLAEASPASRARRGAAGARRELPRRRPARPSARPSLLDPPLHVELGVEVRGIRVPILDALSAQQPRQDLDVLRVELRAGDAPQLP